MNPQLELLLPIPIIEEIIRFSTILDKATFRATCRRFLFFTTEHFFPTFTITLCGNLQEERDEKSIYAQVNSPSFGVLDSLCNCLYVSDAHNHAIRKINLFTHEVTTLCGIPTKSGCKNGMGSEAQFSFPSGLALHEKERILYVSDAWNHIIRSVNLNDERVDTLVEESRNNMSTDGIREEAIFHYPYGLALDSVSNHLYVVDKNNHSIKRVLLKEKRVETLCGNGKRGYANGSFEDAMFASPFDIKFNVEAQELYVTDSWNNAIRIISLENRTVKTLCGIPGVEGCENGSGTQATFRYPGRLELDRNSQCLYVTDNNHVIRRISLLEKAKVDTLCGAPEKKGCKDGFFPTFSYPKGIVVDSHSHSIYVMDYGNDRVRKITIRKMSVLNKEKLFLYVKFSLLLI